VPETTKSGDSYDIALTPEAVEILRERRAERKDTPWVFPSRGVTGHIVDLKGAYKKLLDRAKITNLTQHDLRRTLGSYQGTRGEPSSHRQISRPHERTGNLNLFAVEPRPCSRICDDSDARDDQGCEEKT
jgi:integrase